MAWGLRERESMAAGLEAGTFDLIVVGGGITGAGIFRDAALRGLKVGLVEMDDFAFGTSSRSSKLVHGGLRYLQNGEFGLVHESTTERVKLEHLAAHLVLPLPFPRTSRDTSSARMARSPTQCWTWGWTPRP